MPPSSGRKPPRVPTRMDLHLEYMSWTMNGGFKEFITTELRRVARNGSDYMIRRALLTNLHLQILVIGKMTRNKKP